MKIVSNYFEVNELTRSDIYTRLHLASTSGFLADKCVNTHTHTHTHTHTITHTHIQMYTHIHASSFGTQRKKTLAFLDPTPYSIGPRDRTKKIQIDRRK